MSEITDAYRHIEHLEQQLADQGALIDGLRQQLHEHAETIKELRSQVEDALDQRNDYHNKYMDAIAQRDAARFQLGRAKEWKEAVSNAIKSIPEFHSGQWAGDKEGWGFHFEVVNWLRRERESLQIQVADAIAQRHAAFEEAAKLADKLQAAAGDVLAKGHNADAAAQHDTAMEIAEAIRALSRVQK